MAQCEGGLGGILIGPLEKGARILLMFVGALEERPIEVVLGSAEE